MKERYDITTRGDISYIHIKQRNGETHDILVDTWNLDRVINFKYKWYVCYYKNPNTFYARSTIYKGVDNGKIKNEPILLHRFLLQKFNPDSIDHKNYNGLDNREENLRMTDYQKNSKNRETRNSNNTSGYRNVIRINGYWRVQLQIDGKSYFFPEKFTDVDDAGVFAEQMRQKHYGEFAGHK